MRRTLPAPIGQLFDVGGYRLHGYVAGTGSPTVIFEAGGGSWSLDWHRVQTGVAKFTQTFAYDRAGFGWSDAGPRPRTSEQLASELSTLLSKVGLRPPYILVGASFGGHIVRLYAWHHPTEVAGIILLDARHESINTKMPPAWRRQEATGRALYQVLLWASRVGILPLLGKLMGDRGKPPGVSQLPRELQSMYLSVGFRPQYFQTNLDELAVSPESDRQLSAIASLGSIPVAVIRHGVPDLFSQMPKEQASQAERVWQALQDELAHLSSASQPQVAEHSGHAIQLHQPELVVHAIRQMVEAARAPRLRE
jgi:pimeloyl-ACP methyl ester carboxylesterase